MKRRTKIDGPEIRDLTRRLLVRRDGRKCQLCGKELFFGDAAFTRKRMVEAGDSPTIDHIIPLSEGGSDGLDNLRLTCPPCNHHRDSRVKSTTVFNQIDRTIPRRFRHLGLVFD